MRLQELLGDDVGRKRLYTWLANNLKYNEDICCKRLLYFFFSFPISRVLVSSDSHATRTSYSSRIVAKLRLIHQPNEMNRISPQCWIPRLSHAQIWPIHLRESNIAFPFDHYLEIVRIALLGLRWSMSICFWFLRSIIFWKSCGLSVCFLCSLVAASLYLRSFRHSLFWHKFLLYMGFGPPFF